jgi:hypothetical protein
MRYRNAGPIYAVICYYKLMRECRHSRCVARDRIHRQWWWGYLGDRDLLQADDWASMLLVRLDPSVGPLRAQVSGVGPPGPPRCKLPCGWVRVRGRGRVGQRAHAAHEGDVHSSASFRCASATASPPGLATNSAAVRVEASTEVRTPNPPSCRAEHRAAMDSNSRSTGVSSPDARLSGVASMHEYAHHLGCTCAEFTWTIM